MDACRVVKHEFCSCRPVETEEVLEVAIEMSLDEWKAIQEQSRPKAEFNIRKAETKLPAKAVVIHKSKRLKVIGLLHGMLQIYCLFLYIFTDF